MMASGQTKRQSAQRRKDATLLHTAGLILDAYPELNADSGLVLTLKRLSDELHRTAVVHP